MMPPESELAKTQVPALAQAKREAEYLAKEAEKKADAVDEKQEAVREALAKDEKPEKNTARQMILMLNEMNEKYPVLEKKGTCYMCHKGTKEPMLKPEGH